MSDSPRYITKPCSLTGGCWVIDTNYATGRQGRYNEWHKTEEEATHDAAAKNAGKTRTVAPLTDEQKQKRRETLAKNREKKKDGAEHRPTTGDAGKQRRSRKPSK